MSASDGGSGSSSSRSSPSCSLHGYSLGIFFIIIVAVIWSGASVLTQWIYNNLDFQSPFLVTYVSTALFSLYLPLWRLWVYLGYVKDPPFRREGRRRRRGSDPCVGISQQPQQQQKGEGEGQRQHAQQHDEEEEGEEEEEERRRSQSYQTEPSSASSSSPPSSSPSCSLADSGHGLLEHTAHSLCDFLAPSSTSSSPGSYAPLASDDSPSNSQPPSHHPSNSRGNSHEEVLVIAMKVGRGGEGMTRPGLLLARAHWT